MSNWRVGGALLLSAALLLGGCAASSQYQMGRRALEENDRQAALNYFTNCLRTGENVQEATRELGIMFYEDGKADYARRILEKAVAADSADSRSVLYLSEVYEDVKQYDKAFSLLKLYSRLSSFDDNRDALEAKLDELMELKMQQEARLALSQEAMLDPSTIPDSTLAVLYFSNLGDKTGLDPLQKGIADMIITDLSKVPGIKVIERARLQTLLEEMSLGQAAMVTDGSAPRVGRLLGAAKIINGNFIDLAGRDIRIKAGLIENKQPGGAKGLQVEGPFVQLFDLEKKLVFDIIDQMGIQLSQSQRDEIGRRQTENILAFVAYSKGLDLEDRGMFSQAQQQYSRALSMDPAFSQVALAMNRSQMRSQKPGKLSVKAAPAASDKKPKKTQSEPAAQTEDQSSQETETAPTRKAHMQHVGNVLNQRFLPGIDARKAQQEQQVSSLGDASVLQIVIPLTGLQ